MYQVDNALYFHITIVLLNFRIFNNIVVFSQRSKDIPIFENSERIRKVSIAKSSCILKMHKKDVKQIEDNDLPVIAQKYREFLKEHDQ